MAGNRDQDTSWRLRLLKAEIWLWQSKYRDALSLLEGEGVALTNNPVLLARRNVLIGVAQSNLQQLDLAGRTFRATELAPAGDSPEVLGELLMGEGKLAALRRDMPLSEALLRRALQVSQSNGQTYLASRALGNLGMLEMNRSHFADAVDLFSQALAAAEKLNAQTSMVRTTGNLGWVYLQMGDLERASDLFQDAERRSPPLGLSADLETALVSMAAIRFVKHDYSGAERDYQGALRLARKLDDQQQVAFCLTDLAQTAIEKSEFDLATNYNEEALALERANGDHDTELYSLANRAQISFARGDDATAERLFATIIQNTNTNVKLQVLALTNLAGIDAQLGRIPAAKKHYQRALDSLEKERISLGRDDFKLSYPTNARDTYDGYIKFLIEHSMADEAFRVAELQRARMLTEGLRRVETRSQAFNITEAQRAAAQLGHPILSYWIGRKSSYAWIVLPHQSQLFVLPGEERIRSLAERYRAHLVGGITGNSLADADGLELYRILIGPAEPWIKPQSAVTIISDGALCGLNFETLLVSSPTPHYWIEDISITNASSAFLLTLGSRAKGEQARAPARKLLLIGNPLSPPTYPALTHAGEEISLVGKHFSNDQETVLSGKDATPAAYFKARPENYSLIHFVAHGTASRVSPLDSAVVLSQGGSSYNLYARDVAANRLNARLVTISACDSAGTRIYSSEGLVGLSWAFLRAGAQRVIASLWEVNDAFTPKLMDQLYSSIADGEDPAVALRDAKLTLVRSRGVYSRPFYWAAFVMYQGI